MARRLRLDRQDRAGERHLVFVDSHHAQIRDVICGGMYRACSTWQYEVVAHLIERHLRGERLGYLTGEAYAARFAPFSRRAIHAGVGRRSWRVLKSHEGHRCFARALSSGQALAVYTYRDIRDVVFSLMHKRSLAFEDLLNSVRHSFCLLPLPAHPKTSCKSDMFNIYLTCALFAPRAF